MRLLLIGICTGISFLCAANDHALGAPIPSEVVVEHMKSIVRGECQASDRPPFSLVSGRTETLTLFVCREMADARIWRGYGTFATEYGIQWVKPLAVVEYDASSRGLVNSIDLEMDPGESPTFYGRYNLLNLYRSKQTASDCGRSSRTRIRFNAVGFDIEPEYIDVRERCGDAWLRKYERPGGPR